MNFIDFNFITVGGHFDTVAGRKFSTDKHLRKLILNEEKLQLDLDNTGAVVAEAIQTILRREAYPNPYETLKALTRTNEKLTGDKIRDFIETLAVSENVKEELRAITPATYTGI